MRAALGEEEGRAEALSGASGKAADTGLPQGSGRTARLDNRPRAGGDISPKTTHTRSESAWKDAAGPQ